MNIDRVVATVVAGLALTAHPAVAQRATPEPEADGGGLEEIVMTAQRKEESLQRAAIAVSAVSGDMLEAAGVSKPTELTSLVPALQISPAAGPYSLFYLRGVGSFNGNALSDAAVAFNVDGVYIGRPSSTTGFFYDLIVSKW
ncbi:MAG: TonB-dependent receptor plug domain-containing protein [Ahniella sp.]|nr:TonB-dependent receptor plug domain-containing protein [Ahniella sp.]